METRKEGRRCTRKPYIFQCNASKKKSTGKRGKERSCRKSGECRKESAIGRERVMEANSLISKTVLS